MVPFEARRVQRVFLPKLTVSDVWSPRLEQNNVRFGGEHLRHVDMWMSKSLALTMKHEHDL